MTTAVFDLIVLGKCFFSLKMQIIHVSYSLFFYAASTIYISRVTFCCGRLLAAEIPRFAKKFSYIIMLARYLKDIDLFADMETKLVVAQF